MSKLYLRELMKPRNMCTLWELYIKLNKCIPLSRLSAINVGREQILKDEIDIFKKYLDLSESEIDYLNKLEIDNVVFESHKDFLKLMSLIPSDLKNGEQYVTKCPKCGNSLVISKSDNGHINIVCSKEGLLIIE